MSRKYEKRTSYTEGPDGRKRLTCRRCKNKVLWLVDGYCLDCADKLGIP